MKITPRLLIAVGSIAFPGLGHGVMSRRKSTIAVPVAELLLIWSLLWLPQAIIGLSLALVVNAGVTFRMLGRFPASPPSPADPPTAVVAGNVPVATSSQPNGRLAIVGALITALGLLVTRQFIEGFSVKGSSMAPTIAAGDRVLVEKLSLLWSSPSQGEVVVYESPCRRNHMLVERVIALAGQIVEERCGRVFVDGKPIATSEVAGPCWYDNIDKQGEWSAHACARAHESHGGHEYDVVHRPSGESNMVGFPGEALPTCPDDSLGARTASGTIVVTNDHAELCEQQRHYTVPAGHIFLMGDTRDDAYDSRVFGAVPVDQVRGRAKSIFMTNTRTGPSFGRAGRIE